MRVRAGKCFPPFEADLANQGVHVSSDTESGNDLDVVFNQVQNLEFGVHVMLMLQLSRKEKRLRE